MEVQLKISLFIYLTIILLANTVSAQCNDILNEVNNQNVCTKIKTYKSEKLTKSPILIVALHGDSSNPSYQYAFANQIAKNTDNVVSIGLLRPGFSDPLKRTSDGDKGETVGDNYDQPRIEQVANVIGKLKKQYQANNVILAGHSGGSAIAAKLIAYYPTLIDHAFIVSCPCNIPKWRADMYQSSQYEGFRGKINAISPVDLVDKISSDTGISIFVGKNDDVAKPYLSKEYFELLKSADKKVNYHVINGNHRLFLNPIIIKEVIAVIADFDQ